MCWIISTEYDARGIFIEIFHRVIALMPLSMCIAVGPQQKQGIQSLKPSQNPIGFDMFLSENPWVYVIDCTELL